MCGIAGFIKYSGGVEHHQATSLLTSMANSLSHRGPDDFGYHVADSAVGLAHRRLSILDLSKLGHQPMHSRDNRYSLVFNGEIFNFQSLKEELKEKGYRFLSNTDSEVILASYAEYGVDCVKRFNGMFAFALWDQQEKTVFLARDRAGIKPLYYCQIEDTVIFASEIKAILKYPGLVIRPNEEAIYNYLTVGHQLDEQSWYRGIFSLEPGGYMKVSLSGKLLKKGLYWSPELNINYTRSFASFKEELRETIVDAIKIHQISDVPVGAHLSGGVDSSTIVAIASRFSKTPMHTFSSTFAGLGHQYDEVKEIEAVRARFNTQHHSIVTDPSDVPKILSHLIHHLDEPEVGPALIPMYYVNQAVKASGVLVVNGGHGVDEVFGGYPPNFTLASYNVVQLLLERRHLQFGELLRIPGYLKKGGAYQRFFSKFRSIETVPWLRKPEERHRALQRYTSLFTLYKDGSNSFDANMLMMLKHYLPGLLHQEDRMSMISSIESRVPFLDHRLVELALQIPSYYKVRNGTLKYIFREAMRGLVPETVLENRVKRGYPTPLTIWSRNQLASFYSATLGKKNLLIADLVDPDRLKEILRLHITGAEDHTSTLWACLTAELWMENNFVKG